MTIERGIYMKFLKGLATFILGLLAFVLILALSIIVRTKSLVEKEILTAVVKESTKELVQTNDMNDKQKELVDKIFVDKDLSKIIIRIKDNYLDYQTSSNYKLSEDDYNLIIDFILKYTDEVNSLSKDTITKQEIKAALKYEDVNKFAKDTFHDLTTNRENKDVNEVLTVYVKLTSTMTTILIILAIIILLLLVALVHWSFIKCLKVLGIDLIISGIIIGLLYALGTALINHVNGSDDFVNVVKNIDLNGFMIVAIIEIVLGIGSIVGYKILNKKNKKPEKAS